MNHTIDYYLSFTKKYLLINESKSYLTFGFVSKCLYPFKEMENLALNATL